MPPRLIFAVAYPFIALIGLSATIYVFGSHALDGFGGTTKPCRDLARLLAHLSVIGIGIFGILLTALAWLCTGQRGFAALPGLCFQGSVTFVLGTELLTCSGLPVMDLPTGALLFLAVLLTIGTLIMTFYRGVGTIRREPR
ncbi:MAG: hypothetical protein AAF919_03280 [Pseudomonadota bacterium]